jgi:hypothetical protein
MGNPAFAGRDMDVLSVETRPQANAHASPFQVRVPSLGRIATLESLREHLQWAIEVEHLRCTRLTQAATRKPPRCWPALWSKRCCT